MDGFTACQRVLPCRCSIMRIGYFSGQDTHDSCHHQAIPACGLSAVQSLIGAIKQNH
jgi:hypothetical protein